MGSVGPGEQQVEQAFELLHVDAVLLQVGQAGVMALCGVAAAAPVTAGQVLRLKRKTRGVRALKTPYAIAIQYINTI